MLDNYINKRQINVCSIEQLNHDLYKDQLLLSNDNRNETIIQEEEQDFFELYITPYSEKEQKMMRVRDLSVGEDTTILKESQREESIMHGKLQEQQAEIKRLKKIIMKKNSVIGDLTEELKIYYQQSKKKSHSYKQSARSELSSERGKQNECENNKCRTEIMFFQKNNLELYEQLVQIKEKYTKMEKQFTKTNQQFHNGLTKIQKLESKIHILRKDNTNLLRQAKKYISQGTQQMKIINKMREVLAQKLSLKEMNIHIPDYPHKAKSNRNEKEKVVMFQQNCERNKERIAKSAEKNGNKENNYRERCLSHDAKKHKFNS